GFTCLQGFAITFHWLSMPAYFGFSVLKVGIFMLRGKNAGKLFSNSPENGSKACYKNACW
ncbi:MAG: hypothetical protein ACQES0_10495, partial [Bacteroidota bacterium]